MSNGQWKRLKRLTANETAPTTKNESVVVSQHARKVLVACLETGGVTSCTINVARYIETAEASGYVLVATQAVTFASPPAEVEVDIEGDRFAVWITDVVLGGGTHIDVVTRTLDGQRGS